MKSKLSGKSELKYFLELFRHIYPQAYYPLHSAENNHLQGLN